MTTLVTGASGFLGSHVTRQLVARGETLRVLLRASSNNRAIADLPLEYVTGDFARFGLAGSRIGRRLASLSRRSRLPSLGQAQSRTFTIRMSAAQKIFSTLPYEPASRNSFTPALSPRLPWIA